MVSQKDDTLDGMSGHGRDVYQLFTDVYFIILIFYSL